MHLTLPTLALLTIGACLPAHATPSGTPSSFTCPGADTAGFPLGESNLTTDPIFCSYPAFASESPNDFFCTCSKTTGALVEDHDAGFCPGSAPSTGSTRRRDGNAVARAPLPTRPLNSVRGVKDTAARRNYLKKRRVSPEHPI